MSMRIRWASLLAVGAVALLAGCASTRVVDNQVQTFSQLQAAPAPATYRFYRLPSQESTPGEQARIEAAAEPALAKAGWVRNDAAARYSVQVGSSVAVTTQTVDPWLYSRFGPYGPYYRPWYGAPGFYGWGPSWAFRYDMMNQAYALREVSVIIRELATQQVVYETRAAHESRWPNDPTLLTPMFDAAMSSFPQPPAGVRRVNIELPREPAR